MAQVASQIRSKTISSKRASRRNPRAWGLGFQSAERSSKITADRSGLRKITAEELTFALPFHFRSSFPALVTADQISSYITTSAARDLISDRDDANRASRKLPFSRQAEFKSVRPAIVPRRPIAGGLLAGKFHTILQLFRPNGLSSELNQFSQGRPILAQPGTSIRRKR